MPRLDPEQREKLRAWLRENDRRLWIEGTSFTYAAYEVPQPDGLALSADQVRRHRPKGCRWKGRAARIQHGDSTHTGQAWDKWHFRARKHLKDGRSVQEVARRCIDNNEPVPLSALRGMMMPKGVKLVEEQAARPGAKADASERET